MVYRDALAFIYEQKLYPFSIVIVMMTKLYIWHIKRDILFLCYFQ